MTEQYESRWCKGCGSQIIARPDSPVLSSWKLRHATHRQPWWRRWFR